MAHRTPQAQAQCAAGAYRYINLVANASRDVIICRRVRVRSDAETLAAVEALHAMVLLRHCEVYSVNATVCSQSDYEHIQARAVYFSNICGKVTHCYAPFVLRPEVLPLVVKVDDNFGRCSALYGAVCNLRTSSTNTVTIFRAAKSSRGVHTAIKCALNPESILSCQVHMMVASARLDHNICMQDESIDRTLASDTRWRATTIVKTEEGTHIKSVRLTDVDAAWVRTFGADLQTPDSMLVNVTKNGGVNIFVSVHDSFRVDIEFEYTPLCQAVVDAVSLAS